MKLSSTPAGIEWLRQFDGREVHIARLMLDLLKLVSFSEFEATIIRQVADICAETKGRIAVFAVLGPADERLPGSEGRVNYLLSRLEQLYPRRIRVNQSIASMRAERTKHVILIDDIVGSGRRLGNFWLRWTVERRSLNSWLSSKHCSLWVVVYAAYVRGINYARRKAKNLKPERVRCEFKFTRKGARALWPLPVIDLFEELARRTKRPTIPFGLGELYCPIIFQHGAPNNCPVAVWSKGPEFEPIFPERAIPPSSFPAFISHNSVRPLETLWAQNQYNLALALIDEMQSSRKRSTRFLQLLTMLGLLNRGIAMERLHTVLLTSTTEVRELLLQAAQLGLIDEESNLTEFGNDLLTRARRGFVTTPAPAKARPPKPYLPQSFRGAQ